VHDILLEACEGFGRQRLMMTEMRTAVQEAVSEDLHEVRVGDPSRNLPGVQAEVSERGCVRNLHSAGPVVSPHVSRDTTPQCMRYSG